MGWGTPVFAHPVSLLLRGSGIAVGITLSLVHAWTRDEALEDLRTF